MLPENELTAAVGAARCADCGTLNDLQSPQAAVRPRPLRREATPAAVPIPERFEVEDKGSGIVIRWRWFRLQALMLIPFTLFWNGILLTFAAGVTDGGAHPERLLVGLAVPHVWVGVGLVYACFAALLNTTTVTAGRGRVTVVHGPVPWRGNGEWDASALDQLFSVDRKGKSTVYDLCAVTREGRKEVLVRSLESPDQARFLEARLEAALGIVDRPVDGELRR